MLNIWRFHILDAIEFYLINYFYNTCIQNLLGISMSFVFFVCLTKIVKSCLREKPNLSPSAEPSPSLEALEPCRAGRTSSLRCTVNDVLPFFPNPRRRFRPNPVSIILLKNVKVFLFYFKLIFKSTNSSNAELSEYIIFI